MKITGPIVREVSKLLPTVEKLNIRESVLPPIPAGYIVDVVRIARHGSRQLYVTKDGHIYISGQYQLRLRTASSVWPVLVRLGALTQKQIDDHKANDQRLNELEGKMYSAESALSSLKELGIPVPKTLQNKLSLIIADGKTAQKASY